VIGIPIDRGILAHRRHHDAVGKRQAAQLDRGKQSAHGLTDPDRKKSDPQCLASRRLPLNRVLINPAGRFFTRLALPQPHSTSMNCSSRLRWISEKLSSETSVSTVSPSAVTWASMPSMLSISLPRSASKIGGP